MVNIFVIVTGWNCSGRPKKAYTSLASQTYTNFTALFISDGSTDLTSQELEELPKKKWLKCKINVNNLGAARNRYSAIKRHKPNDVIMFMGMDDVLKPNCLQVIADKYKEGVWMTYGNWQSQKGHPNHISLVFNKRTHKTRNYRKVSYRSTAPNTFKAFLFNKIPKEDFKLDGKWMRTCTESEVMFSCLEMCGENRIGIISEPIYIYYKYLPNGTLRTQGSGFKREVLKRICKRPKKELVNDI